MPAMCCGMICSVKEQLVRITGAVLYANLIPKQKWSAHHELQIKYDKLL